MVTFAIIQRYKGLKQYPIFCRAKFQLYKYRKLYWEMVSKNIIFKQYYVEKLCGTIIYLFYASICVALSCVYMSAFLKSSVCVLHKLIIYIINKGKLLYSVAFSPYLCPII